MNKQETIEILEYLKSTKTGIFLKPEKTWSSWNRKLERYSYNETMSAIEYLEDNTEPENFSRVFGNAAAIKAQCDRSRARREKNERNFESDQHKRQAEASFENVPGKTRTEKIIFIQAERAAEHYRPGFLRDSLCPRSEEHIKNGEKDNVYYNDLLIKARAIGFEFEGVDYETLKGSGKAWKSVGGLGML